MENLIEGFRFRQTDAEAITFLLRFIAGKVMNDCGFITTDSKQEPWDIYSHGLPCGNDDEDKDCSQYRFFITKLKKKSESKYSRNVGNKGSWKQQDKSKPIRKNGGPVIGYKKSMSYVNRSYNRDNGHWLMKEYHLSTKILDKFDNDFRDYVLCAIRWKTPSKDDTMTSYDDPLVVDAGEPQLELQNNMHEETDIPLSAPYTFEGTNIFVEPLSVPYTFEGTNLVVEPLSVPYTFEGTNIIVQPLSTPCTFDPTSILNFDYEYSPADFDCLRSISAS